MIRSRIAMLIVSFALASSARAEIVTFVWHNGVVATHPYYFAQFLPATNKGINDSGAVTGSVQDIQTLYRTASTWNGTDFSLHQPLPGFPESVGNSINNQGSVVGGSIYAGSIEPTAWIDGNIVDLGILPGISGPYGVMGGFANALNESNQVVGFQYANSGAIPILWQNGTVNRLATLPGQDTAELIDINEAGTIVGYSGGLPAMWRNGAVSALPGCAGGASYALNDLGQAVGRCGSDAVLWDASGMTVIGPDVALGIDNHGTVIGRTADDPLKSQTYIWTAAEGMQILPGFVWSEPFSISSENGYILGYGEIAPEPSTVALCCGGLLLLISIQRRRAA